MVQWLRLCTSNVGAPGWIPGPSDSDGKETAYNAGDLSSIPGLGRCPGEGHGNPLSYFCLELEKPTGLEFMGSQRIGHD